MVVAVIMNNKIENAILSKLNIYVPKKVDLIESHYHTKCDDFYLNKKEYTNYKKAKNILKNNIKTKTWNEKCEILKVNTMGHTDNTSNNNNDNNFNNSNNDNTSNNDDDMQYYLLSLKLKRPDGQIINEDLSSSFIPYSADKYYEGKIINVPFGRNELSKNDIHYLLNYRKELIKIISKRKETKDKEPWIDNYMYNPPRFVPYNNSAKNTIFNHDMPAK